MLLNYLVNLKNVIEKTSRWLNETNRISDYDKLNEVYDMFDIYKINLNFSKTRFRNKFYDSKDVRNIMKNNGFIYVN